MKNFGLHALLLAGACAMAAAPAMAQDTGATSGSPVSGYGEIFGGYGYGTSSTTDKTLTDGSVDSRVSSRDQNDLSTLGAGAHVNFDLSPDLGLQVDAQGQDIGVGNDNESVGGFGAHLYHKAKGGLIGGFASFGSAYGSRFATVGLDSKLFLDEIGLKDASFDFQPSYTTAIQGDMQNFRYDSWNLYAGLNYFYTPRLEFSTGVGSAWQQGDDHVSGDLIRKNLNQVNWNAKIEYQLKDSPISVFAKYEGAYGTSFYKDIASGGRDVTDTLDRGNLVMVGLRVYFGNGTLEANDRQGAGFSDHNPIYGNTLL